VSWRVPALIIALGLLIRFAWFFTPAGSPDADEAVFGLMALHVQEGREYPLYCWGAHYAGAVVSYLAALGYSAFGMGAIELKSATLPFAAGYLAVTYGLARLLFDDRSALVALIVAAVPPAVALDISVKATGGYPETLCFGGLVLLLAFRLPNAASSSARLRGHLFLLGFAGGFGFYILPLILPYLAVASLFLVRQRRAVLSRGGWMWVLIGGSLGVSPMVIYNLQFPGATVLRLGSRVLDVSKAEALDSGFGVSVVVGWIMRYLSELPIRLATLVQNVGPLLDLDTTGGALLAWIVVTGAVLALYFHPGLDGHVAGAEHLGRWWAGLAVCVLLFAWVTGLNRPRHLAPLYSVLPLGIAALYSRIGVARPWFGRTILASLMVIIGWDLAQDAPRSKVKPVGPLIQAMQQHGIRGLYADYEISYLVMFFSRETILASPTAWTQAAGLIADRTPDITRQVDRYQAPAYVFFRNGPEAAWFREGLARRNIAFARQRSGDFEVFMGLSMPVRSDALPVSRAW
jgi:hypothetical protein